MKSLLRLALFVAATGLVAPLFGAAAKETANAPAKGPAAPPPLSPRFKQVRDRIYVIFHNRNETPPPPDPKANPVRLPGAPEVAVLKSGGGDGPPIEAASSDLARLQQGVATLKVSGTFEKDGKLYLVINGKPYKDNEIIQTQVQGEPVYLRVRQISRKGATVVLNDAEMAFKF